MEENKNKKPSPKIRYWVNHKRLISIYKIFLNNPLKVFVKKDFHTSYGVIKTHLSILEKLDVIEVVSLLYDYGVNYTARKRIIGYRLKQKKQEEVKEEVKSKTKVIRLWKGEKP